MPLFIALLLIACAASVQQLLDDADFANGMQGWHDYNRGDVKPQFGREGGKPLLSLQTKVAAGDPDPMLTQPVDITEGKTYRFSTELRVQGEDRVILSMKPMERPSAGYGCHLPVTPTAAWKHLEITFKGTTSDSPKPAHAFILMGEVRNPRGELKVVALEDAADSAKRTGAALKKRKAGEVEAYPPANFVAVIAGYRSAALLLRDGKQLSFSQRQQPK
jgi:hypothetical protein